MKNILILGIFLAIFCHIEAKPQYSYPTPSKPFEEKSPSPNLPPAKSNCDTVLVGPGRYQTTCRDPDPRLVTIQAEHILWLYPPTSENQQIDITVPNYKHEELIRAAIKKGDSNSATNVNILLKKPVTLYDVQAQHGGNTVKTQPNVNLNYEPIDAPTSVHYRGDKEYSPLSGPIREPYDPQPPRPTSNYASY